ncbi:MAG: EAL domain-containing protein [Pseudomonadales bacterium]|nr:EAL domain-containing protein [Pseudomonadales bacterium]
MQENHRQLMDHFFDQRSRNAEEQGVNVLLLVDLERTSNWPKSSAVLELLFAAFHERVADFCRNTDHPIVHKDQQAIVLLANITKTSQLRLAAAKLSRIFDDQIQLIDEQVSPEVKAAFVIPTAKKTSANDLLEHAESSLATLRHSTTSYKISKHSSEPPVTEKKGRENKQVDITPNSVAQALENAELVVETKKLLHGTYNSLLGIQTFLQGGFPGGKMTHREILSAISESPVYREVLDHYIRSSLALVSRQDDGVYLLLDMDPDDFKEDASYQTLLDAAGFFDVKPERIKLGLRRSAGLCAERRQNLIKLAQEGFGIVLLDYGVATNLVDIASLPCEGIFLSDQLCITYVDEPRQTKVLTQTLSLASELDLKLYVATSSGLEHANVLVED